MDNSQRIPIASRRLKKICSWLIFCFPLFVLYYWLFFNPLLREIRPLPFPVNDDLPNIYRYSALLIEMISISVVVYGLLRLRELFSLYENGMIFTEKNVVCFRSMGWTLIVWTICNLIKDTLLSHVLPNDPPFPAHYMPIPIHLADVACIFVGIITIIIAWVMDEARKIHEDQSLFL